MLVPQYLYEFLIHKDGVNALTLIERMRPTFFVSPHAEAISNNKKEFIVGPKEDVLIRVFTCESLGVTGWTEMDFFGPKGFEHIKNFGLIECLSDDAFHIRAAHPKQKLDEWIRVAHKSILANDYSSVFRVGHSRDCGCFVGGCDLHSYDGLGPDRLVALRLANPKN